MVFAAQLITARRCLVDGRQLPTGRPTLFSLVEYSSPKSDWRRGGLFPLLTRACQDYHLRRGASAMNGVVEELVEEVRRLISRRREEGKDQSRVLIGVCGIPGSGKSQLAAHVADRLNAGLQERQTVVIGMDGWHLTRDELARMKDPEKARARRGAPWTFDDEVGNERI